MMESGPLGYAVVILVLLFAVVVMGLCIGSLVWVYRDAQRRKHQNAGLIAFLCFLCNWPFSLILYIVMRKDLSTDNSTKAYSTVEP